MEQEQVVKGKILSKSKPQNKAPNFWTLGIELADGWHNATGASEDSFGLFDDFNVGDNVNILEKKKGNYWNISTIEHSSDVAESVHPSTPKPAPVPKEIPTVDMRSERDRVKQVMLECKEDATEIFGEDNTHLGEHINSMFIEVNKKCRKCGR